MSKRNRGFTLIELMVVVVIVAILSAVAIPFMGIPRKRAMSSEGMTGIGVIKTYLACYYADHEEYTDDMSLLIPTHDRLDGNFFVHSDYSVVLVDSGYQIRCQGSTGHVTNVVLTLNHEGTWTINYDGEL